MDHQELKLSRSKATAVQSTSHPYYGQLLGDLKTRIRLAQSQALHAVNQELFTLYWDIGRNIAEQQLAQGWSAGIVDRLSQDLRFEFGEKSGYSSRNLRYMQLLYREYKEHPILQPLAAKLAWTKNTLILDRCPDHLQRQFYLMATAKFGWTRRVLDHQIDGQAYEKYLLNQTSFDQALPPAVAAQAKLAVKDHYTFDFLSLGDEHEEREELKPEPLPIGVATYGITSTLPEALRGLLPSEEAIAERLAGWVQE